MSEQGTRTSRTPILAGVMAVLALIAVVVWATSHRSGRPRPELTTGAVYYTGPMVQKGNPNMVADEDGKIYPPSGNSSVTAQKQAGAKPGKTGAAPD
jgi:hypothetical protein